MADSGEGPGGLGPPLFLDQTEAQRANKKLLKPGSPPFSKGLDDRPPPPLSQGLDPALFCVIITLSQSKGCKL